MMQYLGSDDNISLGYDLDDGEIGNIETIRSSSSVIFPRYDIFNIFNFLLRHYSRKLLFLRLTI